MLKSIFTIILIHLSVFNIIYAQKIDSLKANSAIAQSLQQKPRLKVKYFIIPSVAVAYGSLATPKGPLSALNLSTRTELKEDHPLFKSRVDNLSQFAPAATVFALQVLGSKGKNNIKNEAIIYSLAMATTAAVVYPIKKITKVMRPDSSSATSFPSGHTATAFVAAEFLRKEYGQLSPWYGIAGYIAAAGTGALRMLNNKHWLGDVVAGAGIGIASTELAYFIHDRFRWKRNTKISINAFPYYYNKTFGVAFCKQL